MFKQVFLVFAVLFAVISCAEKPISNLSPEEGITRIRASHADEYWERVVSDVNEYRSRYPYSQYAPEAELLQADAYFKSGRYAESVAAYEEFMRKNPTHNKASFAAFRLGQSYDFEAPEEVDREQDFALKAIEKYAVYLERYPNSEWTKEAKDRLSILRRRIAEHSLFIARFYWRKDLYQGALSRYMKIIEEHGQYEDLKLEARQRAAESYLQLADLLEKDPKSDKIVYFRNSTPAELRKKADLLRSSK